MAVHEFDRPERFVVGTVGPPGQRTFFIQAREGRRLMSVSCEKQQISVLADRVNDLLDRFAGGLATEQAAAAYSDDAALDTPIDDEFRVAALALTWDPDAQEIVIEAHRDAPDLEDYDEGEDDGEDVEDPGPGGGAGSSAPLEPAVPADAEVLRVHLTPARARAFARRATLVIAAGRPSCPFCGGPLDLQGHICPRANGYRRG